MAPSEGKKDTRRLLSFDTLSRSSSSIEAPIHPQPLKPLTLQEIIDDEEIKGETTGSSQETWTAIDSAVPPPTSDYSWSRASSPMSERRRKLAPSRSTTPDATVPASSSRKRWDQLRQHVLPVYSRSNTPPVQGLPSGVSQTFPPTRSQTPVQKPSRLARLGFRHVVEHAREADETLRISQEFETVCWSIRMAEPQKVKGDTTSSSLHLTFMSNTSLASEDTSTVERHPHAYKKHDLRRPQSIQSLTTYRTVPIVKPLYQLLLHHATPSVEKRVTLAALPHESLVLSTLLSPFFSTEQNPQLEEERWNAVEAFEMITRSWTPHNEGKGVERYLWCCKAATIPPGAMRTRILSILWGLIVPTDNNYVISTPECFQTLAQGLFSLLPHLRPLSSSSIAHEEVPFLMDVISKVRDGCCGELEAHFVQQEYDAIASPKDDKNLIREAILLEALSRCLEDCTNDSRVWLFQHVVEHYWIKCPTETRSTPLLSAIYTRTLNGLGRALLTILSIPLDQEASLQRAQRAAQLIQKRLIPDVDALGDAVKPQARMNIVNAVLELVCMDRASESVRWGLSLLHTWYRESSLWKSHLDLTLQDFISKGTWLNIISKLAALVRLLPDEVRKPMVAFVLPLLYDRLVEGPPPFPCISLTNLLDIISRLYPQIFYKPLFLCAASSKGFTDINHLCVIGIVSKFLPDFWIRDAEMMSVALMSDGGKKAPDTERKTWTKPKLGQAVVILELIAFIQSARREKEASSHSDSPLAETIKFITALEVRLAILLEARERTTLLAPSQRLLFCVLLREMRLFTRSLKSTSWLVQIVGWCIDIHTDDGTGPDPEEEEKGTIGQIQELYTAAQDGVRSTTQYDGSLQVASKAAIGG
ncbi:hypothetical protein C0995_005941 [Termitomyces sp. Mi166|nr:hypothetical protein C0995_005941 [Termitomyces sp. Mi166\